MREGEEKAGGKREGGRMSRKNEGEGDRVTELVNEEEKDGGGGE